ncbi:MAG: TerB family tellurite resistance protein [Oligoflexia bacterium]|nr:TerB family tellurite resistance protein [Oligoflexia bacterium]
MGLWNKLFNTLTGDQKSYANSLHEKVEKLLQDTGLDQSESEQIKIACLSGLMARVAYIDFHFDESEKAIIEESLSKWTKLSPQEIKAVAELAYAEVKNLAGLENYLYSNGIKDLLNAEEKYDVLESLFAIAAAHDGVDEKESEEIRTICQGLALEHKYFLSARATVLDSLNALKG